MKLQKSEIIKMAEISVLDADIRLDEFKKYKNIKSNKKNYDINRIKALWPNANYFDIGNIEGLYGELDDSLFITARGSDDLIDWIRNFIFFKKVIPYEGTNPKIRIHAGFLKNYKIIREFIHNVVKNYPHINKIIIYGHSMGGVIGSLMALDIQYNFSNKEIGCFSVGMPRLGNKAFKESFERRLPDFIRCDYGDDIVPQFPPKCFGFANLEKFIQLGPDRKRLIGKKSHHDWHLYLDAIKNMNEEII